MEGRNMKVTPWYKQFWPWFLIILPACAVAASVYTFILAANSQFSMVSEDYYKEGKGINQDLSRIRAAKNLGLTFALEVDDKEIRIVQHGGQKVDTAIELEFHHATLAQNDFVEKLFMDGTGTYRLRLDAPLDGKWLVQIDAYDQSWRLQTRATLPHDGVIWLN